MERRGGIQPARGAPSASVIPIGGTLFGSPCSKNPRRASIAATMAQAARTTPLTTAIRDSRAEVRSRHKTRKIATTTAAVSASTTTASRSVDTVITYGGRPARAVKVP